jgi:hypothetical protein
MQTVNDLRRRITSAYPQWYEWTMLQRMLLMLRATHGEFTIKTDDYNSPLKELEKALNQDYLYIENAIANTPSLVKAFKDYREQDGYRYGKTKKGKKMKRRCTQQDLMQLIAYDNVPAAIVAISTGAKPRFADSEKPYLEQWLQELDKTPKPKDSNDYYDDEIRPFNRDIDPSQPADVNIFNLPPSVRKIDYSADGLPNFDVDEQETQPETHDETEEENLFD